MLSLSSLKYTVIALLANRVTAKVVEIPIKLITAHIYKRQIGESCVLFTEVMQKKGKKKKESFESTASA